MHVFFADELLLQLHAHFKSGVGPLVSAPSAHTLAEIAALYIARANWEAAMAIATELPGQKKAAKIVSRVVQGFERSDGSLMKVTLPGLHMLHETQRHADIVKVRLTASLQWFLNLWLIPNTQQHYWVVVNRMYRDLIVHVVGMDAANLLSMPFLQQRYNSQVVLWSDACTLIGCISQQL